LGVLESQTLLESSAPGRVSAKGRERSAESLEQGGAVTATAVRCRSPPCRRCGCRTQSRRAACATRERWSRHHTVRPSRQGRARPGGRMPCTRRSAAHARRQRSRGATEQQGRRLGGRPRPAMLALCMAARALTLPDSNDHRFLRVRHSRSFRYGSRAIHRRHCGKMTQRRERSPSNG
jgi:hypothetical protein